MLVDFIQNALMELDVMIMPPYDADQIRAELLRFPNRRARFDAKGFSFITRGNGAC